jgi:citrate lyase subunit beta / citryl-CoA lyase
MIPLFRTLLFSPGSDENKMLKAFHSFADALIFDIEDSVAMSEKEIARKLISKMLKTNNDHPIFVRINSALSEVKKDLNAIMPSRPYGIMIPKVEDAKCIENITHLISELEISAGINKGSTKIIPIIESASGILKARDICLASGRILALCFGAIDYALDINIKLTSNGFELLYPRSYLVLASREAGINPPIDTVYPCIKDIKGLENDTMRAKQLGMYGKLVIHPNQIERVNKIFTPSAEEIKNAISIVEAFKKAEEQGLAAIEVNGSMVDYPVFKKAKRILEYK